jgi:hypothetical protein
MDAMMCTGVIHLKGKLPRIWASPQIKNSMRCPTLTSLYIALLPLPILVYKRTMMGFYYIRRTFIHTSNVQGTIIGPQLGIPWSVMSGMFAVQ